MSRGLTLDQMRRLSKQLQAREWSYAAAQKPPPLPLDPNKLKDWLKIHEGHGRGGPRHEVDIGVYRHYRCPCGDKKIVEIPK